MKYRIINVLTIECCGEQKYQSKVLYSDNDRASGRESAEYIYNHERCDFIHVSSTPKEVASLIQEKHEKMPTQEMFDLLHVLQTKKCQDLKITFHKVENQNIIFSIRSFDQIIIKYDFNHILFLDSNRDLYAINNVNHHVLEFIHDLLKHPLVRLKLLMK